VRTLTLAPLRQRAMGVIDYGLLEAGLVIMALPCMLLLLGLQGRYVRGLHVRSKQGLIDGECAVGAPDRSRP
jgi:ABC-type glycerol-3-phosphate transport system permease component